MFAAAHQEQVHRETENVVMRVRHVAMPQGGEAGQICTVARRGFAVSVFPVASYFMESCECLFTPRHCIVHDAVRHK